MGMFDSLENRRRQKRALTLVGLLETREAIETHAVLQQPLANMIHEEAVLRLGRECQGDNDTEHFAEEDAIARQIWSDVRHAIDQMLER